MAATEIEYLERRVREEAERAALNAGNVSGAIHQELADAYAAKLVAMRDSEGDAVQDNSA